MYNTPEFIKWFLIWCIIFVTPVTLIKLSLQESLDNNVLLVTSTYDKLLSLQYNCVKLVLVVLVLVLLVLVLLAVSSVSVSSVVIVNSVCKCW